jgi:hypothetical protein
MFVSLFNSATVVCHCVKRILPVRKPHRLAENVFCCLVLSWAGDVVSCCKTQLATSPTHCLIYSHFIRVTNRSKLHQGHQKHIRYWFCLFFSSLRSVRRTLGAKKASRHVSRGMCSGRCELLTRMVEFLRGVCASL